MATKKPVSRRRSARLSRKRRRKMAGRDHDLTDEQWSALVSAWGGCAYCAVPVSEANGLLQKDTVQPVSHGGSYTLANVVPACRSCNASKSNSEVTGWLRRKRLDEGRFLVRHAEVLRSLSVDGPDPDPE